MTNIKRQTCKKRDAKWQQRPADKTKRNKSMRDISWVQTDTERHTKIKNNPQNTETNKKTQRGNRLVQNHCRETQKFCTCASKWYEKAQSDWKESQTDTELLPAQSFASVSSLQRHRTHKNLIFNWRFLTGVYYYVYQLQMTNHLPSRPLTVTLILWETKVMLTLPSCILLFLPPSNRPGQDSAVTWYQRSVTCCALLSSLRILQFPYDAFKCCWDFMIYWID